MKNRKLLKIAAWTLSIFVFLFTVLVVHIYTVTKPVVYDNADLQLSRIDFKQKVDSAEAIKISHFVAHLPGVSNAMFNIKDRTLVYGYTLGKQSSGNVYTLLMDYGHYKANRYVVTAAQANTGCPLGKDKNSFAYRLSATIAKIF